jgi:hypothetical protein
VLRRTLASAVAAGMLACSTPDSSSVGSRTIQQPAGAATTQPDSSELARTFVQGFYDWYAPFADTSGAPGAIGRTLSRKPSVLGTRLASALREDSLARHEPGRTEPPRELLNYDPFLYSQDPCGSFRADSVKQLSGAYRVSVREACPGNGFGNRPFALDVIGEGGRWVITDVVYGEKSSLIAQLCQLALRDDRPDRRPKDCASWPP